MRASPQKIASQKANAATTKQDTSAWLPVIGAESMSYEISPRHTYKPKRSARLWYGPSARTTRCLSAVEQITGSDEGKRNMKHLDRRYLDDMDSRDVIQWSSSLMQEFKVHFTAKVKKVRIEHFSLLNSNVQSVTLCFFHRPKLRLFYTRRRRAKHSRE